ncbi:YjjG family noncanonical pyrimidine nucleotidase [Limisphaera sp. VF-2]|jgi:YjjG family noncanonical pyrimidine nucleotidase|uniref:YjjG family noncanonical pyrimidine nucleotidase n=1 Tax=Limisphaera sp. VF-2 TaxID=3400418 RepID=UPI00175CB794
MGNATEIPYEWLWFDADGVVFDYDRAEQEALACALRSFGHSLTPGLLKTYRAINQELWAALERSEISAAELKTLRFERFLSAAQLPGNGAEFGERYLEALARMHMLWPGCETFLPRLRSRYRLGLLTNGLLRVQQPRLERAGLLICFDVVLISEEIGAAKPSRTFYQIAWEQSGRPPLQRVLMIGDNWNADVAGAAAFGVHTCWFNPEGRSVPDNPAVQRVVRSWAELAEWLLPEHPATLGAWNPPFQPLSHRRRFQ